MELRSRQQTSCCIQLFQIEGEGRRSSCTDFKTLCFKTFGRNLAIAAFNLSFIGKPSGFALFCVDFCNISNLTRQIIRQLQSEFVGSFCIDELCALNLIDCLTVDFERVLFQGQRSVHRVFYRNRVAFCIQVKPILVDGKCKLHAALVFRCSVVGKSFIVIMLGLGLLGRDIPLRTCRFIIGAVGKGVVFIVIRVDLLRN